MELPALQAGPGGRPLHRRRSLLSDPYKAQAVGYHPEIILAGRRLNDRMGAWIAGRVVKLMTRRDLMTRDSRVLVLGLTFKENCPDLRNTRVVDIVRELADYGLAVDVHDPWVDPREAEDEYGIAPIGDPEPSRYQAIVLAVAHRQFKDSGVGPGAAPAPWSSTSSTYSRPMPWTAGYSSRGLWRMRRRPSRPWVRVR